MKYNDTNHADIEDGSLAGIRNEGVMETSATNNVDMDPKNLKKRGSINKIIKGAVIRDALTYRPPIAQYNHGTSLDVPDGHISVYLPKGITLDDLPAKSRPTRVKMAHYLSVLYLVTGNKDEKFCCIHSRVIYKIYSSAVFDPMIKSLIKEGLVICDNKSDIGGKTLGYQLSDQYREGLVLHQIKAKSLRKRLDTLYEEGEVFRQERMDNYMPWEKQLHLDLLKLSYPDEFNPAEFVEIIKLKEKKKCSYPPEMRRKIIYDYVIKLVNKTPFILKPQNEKNLRLSHPYINLQKEFRRNLLIDCELCGEVDLSNSQPFFFGSTITNNLIEKYPKLAGFRKVVSAGKFYEVLTKCYEMVDPDFDGNRDTVKIDNMRYGFFRNRKVENGRMINPFRYWEKTVLYKAYDKLFGSELNMLIDHLEENEKQGHLPVQLQRREAEIFIGMVLPELQRRGIPAIPFHDSILCKQSDVNEVGGVIYQTILRECNLEPTLQITLDRGMKKVKYDPQNPVHL